MLRPAIVAIPMTAHVLGTQLVVYSTKGRLGFRHIEYVASEGPKFEWRIAMRTLNLAVLAIVFAATVSTTAQAAETVTYSYDAKGRLTKVQHAGGPADGVISAYAFDKADNRTRQTVTGSILSGSVEPFVVAPSGSGFVILFTGKRS